MSEENFDELLNESTRSIRKGETVEGTVLEVNSERIILNVHYKYDGIVTKDEYSNDPEVDLTAEVNVGDTMMVKVIGIQDSEVRLSYKRIKEEKANKRVEEAFNNEEVLTVRVDKITSGGLITLFEGARIFVPASLVSDGYEKDLSGYLGKDIDIVVTEYNPAKRRVIGNRKKLIVAEKEKRAQELLETLQVNDIVEGVVKSITSFGAFVDLGGIDGLLHISEMSWGRVDSPKSIVKVGETITVFIKNIENGKIALSSKFPDKNPWRLAAEKYAPGTIVTGKVARMTDFGAFIELEPGIDALLHVSQISKKRVKTPSDVLKTGQMIDAKVVDFKAEEKKISLSRKDFDDDLVPDEPEETAPEEETAPAEETAPVQEAAPAEETAPAVEETAAAAADAASEEAAAEETAAEETAAETEEAAQTAEETAEETSEE